MRQVDWVVVPSIWWENSPLVIQEAFLHGRPLITSDIGGMKEKVTDGVNGIHFRVGSAEDLADKLSQVLHDDTAWQRLHDAVPTPLSHADSAAQHLELYHILRAGAATRLRRGGRDAA
jgi:glycosyltransferase involved in cell wall biosynthesis